MSTLSPAWNPTLERRETDRWPIDGIATAFEVAGDGFGRMHTLRRVDYGHRGIGAHTVDPMVPGTEVSIGFQAPGYPAKRGSVLRCRPSGDGGYRVAVVFAARLAA